MPPFLIKARRINASLSDDKGFFWFYVGISVELQPGNSVTLDEVAVVEYHLEDESIARANRVKRVTNADGGFEYRLWLYGFIKVSADVVTKRGELIKLPTTKLSWKVEDKEVALNGRYELSWD